MSATMTNISLPHQRHWSGLQDWGVLTAEQMIEFARDYAAHLRAQADAIDAAADEDFEVKVVKGRIVQHFVRFVQEAKKPT